MPESVSYKPQTLRQAKKAYRVAPIARASDSELRKLKRASELQERAEQIKEKEKRKQLNKKKRAEKEQKEKDAKKKMGRDEEEEKISPRQVRIGIFLGKRKRDDDDVGANTCSRERTVTVDSAEKEEQKPKRRPLQEIDENTVSRTIVNLEAKEREGNITPHPKSMIEQLGEDDWSFFLDSNTQIEREISTLNREAPCTSNPSLRKVPLISRNILHKEHKPPKPPVSPSIRDLKPLSISTHKTHHTLNPPTKTATSSPRMILPQEEYKPRKPTIPALIQVFKPLEETFDVLDFPLISTQDLDFADDDDARMQAPKSPTKPISDFPLISTQDLDFTEEDLRDLGVTTSSTDAHPAPKPSVDLPPHLDLAS